jgi:hypothetical protein
MKLFRRLRWENILVYGVVLAFGALLLAGAGRALARLLP